MEEFIIGTWIYKIDGYWAIHHFSTNGTWFFTNSSDIFGSGDYSISKKLFGYQVVMEGKTIVKSNLNYRGDGISIDGDPFKRASEKTTEKFFSQCKRLAEERQCEI